MGYYIIGKGETKGTYLIYESKLKIAKSVAVANDKEFANCRIIDGEITQTKLPKGTTQKLNFSDEAETIVYIDGEKYLFGTVSANSQKIKWRSLFELTIESKYNNLVYTSKCKLSLSASIYDLNAVNKSTKVDLEYNKRLQEENTKKTEDNENSKQVIEDKENKVDKEGSKEVLDEKVSGVTMREDVTEIKEESKQDRTKDNKNVLTEEGKVIKFLNTGNKDAIAFYRGLLVTLRDNDVITVSNKVLKELGIRLLKSIETTVNLDKRVYVGEITVDNKQMIVLVRQDTNNDSKIQIIMSSVPNKDITYDLEYIYDLYYSWRNKHKYLTV